MKKLLIFQIAFFSFVFAQVSLQSFVGESLAYDVIFASNKVAEIKIDVGLINDSIMSVDFNSETIGWAQIIFNEKDSVHTEIDLQKLDFIYSYRLADWRYLGIFDITEVFLTKNASYMTYRYEKDVLFSNKNRILINDTVMVSKDLMPYNLQEVLSASMLLRLEDISVGEWLNLYILGSEEGLVGPRIVPMHVESLDTIAVSGIRLETLRCRIVVPDDNWLFRKAKIKVWITNDAYHLPLRGTFAVIDSIGLRVDLNLEKSHIPYWEDVQKQLIIK